MKPIVGSDIKIAYVLLNGVSDLPPPILNGLTSLDPAYTANMNYLVKNECMGEGFAPQYDIAVFNMLGYSFRYVNYVARRVIEAIGNYP
ncbi:MAG TPA: hypothetical protein VFI73_13190 [Candidatus Nitrosopolaris sp.]|nr:hypothetical protein [Candidatus Nitrosopolaris sp.]